MNVQFDFSGRHIMVFGGTTGKGAPRYTSFTGGKNPIWNLYGHERMGWLLSLYGPATAAKSHK